MIKQDCHSTKENALITEYTSSDCRTEEGVTVGIIDAIIMLCRILKDRDLTTKGAQEALKDLSSDEDFASLISAFTDITEIG